MSLRVAVIGGGPGGLLTAYLLQRRCRLPFETTIYEASGRLGGKILTGLFESAAVRYEAGAAELYDYSHTGEDPLRGLIDQLGLVTEPMSGASILLGEQVMHDLDDVGRLYGEPARRALREFDDRAKRWMSPKEYYDSDWAESNADPMTRRTFEQELALVPDRAARDFLRTMVHSDVATEPHRTSASYGLQNYLMNDPEYLRLYTIVDGIERLPEALAASLEARVLLRQPVVRVEQTGTERLCIRSRSKTEAGESRIAAIEYDFVVVALPNSYLPAIQWGGGRLSGAMHRHHMHYDHPAHYLRVSMLFREVFWRHVLVDSYFMTDAFGGCCLYDESARNGAKTHGALGWLLAGEAAVSASNLSDEELIEQVLDSLPASLQTGRALFLEGKVHRWIGAVNALPGGSPMLDLRTRHSPDDSVPNLFMVGDYLFDSTLNGVLDSADYVSDALNDAMHAVSLRAEMAEALP